VPDNGLVEVIVFVSMDFLLGENLSSMIRAMMVLVHRYLLGGVSFGEDRFLVLSWWCLIRWYKD
jgi:hypothetical protein